MDRKYPKGTSKKTIELKNYIEASKEGHLNDIVFFRNFILSSDSEKKKMLNPKKLDGFLKLRKWRKDNHENIKYFSTYDGDWLPSWVVLVECYIVSGGWGNKILVDLGTDLLRLNMLDEFEVLSKYDERAKVKKLRTRLPKELIGKELKFTKIEDGLYEVKIQTTKTVDSYYHKKLKEIDNLYSVKNELTNYLKE